MVAGALVFASCGGGETSTTDSSAESTTTAAESKSSEGGAAARAPEPTQVSTGVPSGRPVLVSETGETLYSFENDPKGG